ncbi:hypothetical protein BDR07DRAFT_1511568 [Suillus spraguei]|nr:hypothetical protein BDR07DRAFT_1511568 [Suillus spraguei]
MPSQQVKVHPPSATHRLGNCGIVLLRTQNSDHIIAQVRRIFALSMRGAVLPPALAQPFIYVQPFEIVMYPWDDPAVLMHHVKYWFVTEDKMWLRYNFTAYFTYKASPPIACFRVQVLKQLKREVGTFQMFWFGAMSTVNTK